MDMRWALELPLNQEYLCQAQSHMLQTRCPGLGSWGNCGKGSTHLMVGNTRNATASHQEALEG